MSNFSEIKFFFYRVLVWCAGSNPDILENKARFSDIFICGRSEQIKHAWTGALVLIPPTLAFCGMLYAAATLSISQAAVITIAFVWATVVFILERYIVSSFRKSDSVIRDLISVTFVVRLIFSIGVGFTIADPLIHGVFKESIEKKLSEMNQSEIDSIRSNARLLIAEQEDKLVKLDSEQKAKKDSIARFDTKLTDEIDGLIGRSSGIIGDGPSAKEKRKIRDRLLNESQTQHVKDSLEKIAIDSTIAKIESVREQKIKDKKFSSDYLARRHALAVLAADPANADIWWVRFFLTIFLIFIDVCCILYKAATSKGAYDDHLNYEDLLSDIDGKIKANELETNYQAKKKFNQENG